MLGFCPREEHVLIGRGGAGDAAADVRRESHRGSSGVRGEGGGELGKQVVQYTADSAATCNMTPDADGLTNYTECSRPLGLANEGTTSIAGYGHLTVEYFPSGNGWVHV